MGAVASIGTLRRGTAVHLHSSLHLNLFMPHSLTLNILQNHYRVVLCLRDYLSQICGPQLVLEEQSDTESYRSLVKTSYVALLEPHDVSRKATFGTGQVMSEMYEVGRPLCR